MPTYTFDCTACGVGGQEHVMSMARYTELLDEVPCPSGYRFPEIECSNCKETEVLTRDPAADWGTSYTERPMTWGDTTPLEGQGGYSRERQKILDANGLRQKDGARRGPRKRRHYDRSRVSTG